MTARKLKLASPLPEDPLPPDPFVSWLDEVKELLTLAIELPSRLQALSHAMPPIEGEAERQVGLLSDLWSCLRKPSSHDDLETFAKFVGAVQSQHHFMVSNAISTVGGHLFERLEKAIDACPPDRLPDDVIFLTRGSFTGALLEWNGDLLAPVDQLRAGHPAAPRIAEPYWYGRSENEDSEDPNPVPYNVGRAYFVLGSPRRRLFPLAGVLDRTSGYERARKREVEDRRALKKSERIKAQNAFDHSIDGAVWRIANLERELEAMRARAAQSDQSPMSADSAAGTGDR